MMGFEEFVSGLKGNVEHYLPDDFKNAEIIVQEQTKLNDSYLGMMLRKPEENVCPAINLNSFYDQYQEGRPLSDILENALRLLTQEVPKIDVSEITNYENIKDHLFIKVFNADRNAEILENLPHRLEDDIAITYHVATEIKDGCIASFAIRNELLEKLGVTEEQLHQDAMESAVKIMPLNVTSMINTMKGIMREQGASPEEIEMMVEISKAQNPDMWIVSTDQKIAGAAALFYPGVMDQIAEKCGSDYFVIPSSTEEVIVLPNANGMRSEELSAMIGVVNDEHVSPTQQLGSEAYHYDPVEKVFEKAGKYEQRMEDKKHTKEKLTEKNSILKKLDDKKKDVAKVERTAAKPNRSADMAL